MWLDEVVDPDDDLRQGDLIQGFYAPKLKLPLTMTVTGGQVPGENDFAMAKLGRQKYLLVVSQCCTLENDRVVSVAPVESSKPLSPELREVYANPKLPQDDGDLGYMYSAHLIESYSGEHPPPLDGGRVNIANFLSIQTYSGDISELQARRVARMTVLARRDLRRKLAAFWGRAEAEDRKALEDLREPLT